MSLSVQIPNMENLHRGHERNNICGTWLLKQEFASSPQSSPAAQRAPFPFPGTTFPPFTQTLSGFRQNTAVPKATVLQEAEKCKFFSEPDLTPFGARRRGDDDDEEDDDEADLAAQDGDEDYLFEFDIGSPNGSDYDGAEPTVKVVAEVKTMTEEESAKALEMMGRRFSNSSQGSTCSNSSFARRKAGVDSPNGGFQTIFGSTSSGLGSDRRSSQETEDEAEDEEDMTNHFEGLSIPPEDWKDCPYILTSATAADRSSQSSEGTATPILAASPAVDSPVLSPDSLLDSYHIQQDQELLYDAIVDEHLQVVQKVVTSPDGNVKQTTEVFLSEGTPTTEEEEVEEVEEEKEEEKQEEEEENEDEGKKQKAVQEEKEVEEEKESVNTDGSQGEETNGCVVHKKGEEEEEKEEAVNGGSENQDDGTREDVEQVEEVEEVEVGQEVEVGEEAKEVEENEAKKSSSSEEEMVIKEGEQETLIATSKLTALLSQLEQDRDYPKMPKGTETEGAVRAGSEERRSDYLDPLEDNTPKLRKCSSLRTGKTPPGTPHVRKIVRFADIFGLDLTQVKTFADEIPHIPRSAFSDLQVDMSDFEVGGSPRPATPLFGGAVPPPAHKSTTALVPMFNQPGGASNFFEVLQSRKVCLENAFMVDGDSISGVVRVQNLDFRKSVTVRWTVNNWLTHNDVLATYVTGSSDGFTDKFSFRLSPGQLDVGSKVQFCMQFNCAGTQFWDSNGGGNYVFQVFVSNPPGVAATSRPQAITIAGGGRRHAAAAAAAQFQSTFSHSPSQHGDDPWLRFM